MVVILFRFEKEKINFLSCEMKDGDLRVNKKEKISLVSSTTRGQRYQQILVTLSQIKEAHAFDCFAYQAPQKYRGAIKDEESFANAEILHLFCEQQQIELLELTPPKVRDSLGVANKIFKEAIEVEKQRLIDHKVMAKSDKLLDGLVLLLLLKLRTLK